MKLARIFMALMLLTAIVFRSLPDSVFDYFHSHTHVNHIDTASSNGFQFEEYAHYCHIADWDYLATEISHSFYLTATISGSDQNPPVHLSEYIIASVKSSGRAPPVAS